MTVRKRALAVAVSGVIVTGIAAAGRGQGYPAAQIPLRAGVAWLASNRVGQLALLDGSSAEIAARVPVARPGSLLAAAQQGMTGYAVNRSDGSIVRVDGATFRTVRRDAVLPRARDEFWAVPTANSLYAFDGRRGALAVADPGTLAPREELLTLAAGVTPESSAVDARGRLWVLDRVSGDLVWVESGRRRVRPGAGTPGRALLTTVGGRIVLVDPPRSRAELLDPGSGMPRRSVPLGLGPGDAVSASGSAHGDKLYVVVGARRLLAVCSFEAGSCAAPVRLGAGPGDLGAAVEARGRVLVPDFSLGRVWIADPARMSVVAKPDVFGRPLRFELLVRDGVVFYNDPDSEQAGVIELDGRIRRASKYDTAKVGSTGPGGPDTGGEHGETAPTLPPTGDDPRQVGGPPTPAPGSPSGPPGGPGLGDSDGLVAIEARPGLRGRAGERFTFTVTPAAGVRITSARWTFGDGASGRGLTVPHRWQRPGAFQVGVAAVLADGRRPLASVTVVVGAEPGAMPTAIDRLAVPDRVGAGTPVRFGAVTSGTPPQRWEWTVVDTTTGLVEFTSKVPQVDHTFTTSGRYRVSLVVAGGRGSDRASKLLTVLPPPARKVACGEVITEHTTLAADLGPCGGPGWLSERAASFSTSGATGSGTATVPECG